MADGNTNPTHDLWENGEEVYENGEYMTERITRKSVDFIRKHSDEPFLLYVAYNAPHYPMHAPEKYIKRFPYLSKDRQIMAAMISAVDDGVGEIRDELKRLGLLENTIIYFQSDNGPSRESRNWLDGTEDYYYGGTAGIFSGHKFSLFEGGIRIPAILSWYGRTKSSVENAPHISTDIFPTILELCGGNPDEYELDGMSLVPMVKGEGSAEHEYLFWEMEGQTAARKGKYKLVLNGQLVEGEEQRAEIFLSDLESDPGEKYNLADELSELCNEMKEKALNWRAEIENVWEEKFASNYKNLT
jgi:arylsulfatase A-like enzyme